MSNKVQVEPHGERAILIMGNSTFNFEIGIPVAKAIGEVRDALSTASYLRRKSCAASIRVGAKVWRKLGVRFRTGSVKEARRDRSLPGKPSNESG